MMKGRWFDSGLIVAAALSLVGLVRSLMVLSPPTAADLPEPLRREGPKLAGYRSIPELTKPAWRERDVAWGPTHRYRLVPLAGPTRRNHGGPLLLDLVVRRHRIWHAMALPELPAARKVMLTPGVQVMLGEIGTRKALQTCLVGAGQDEAKPSAAVDQNELEAAIIRWNERQDPAATKSARLQKMIAVQTGLRVNRRWECLLITLKLESNVNANAESSRKQLLNAWVELAPELKSWGQQWDGAAY